jgi:hypothetical protein
MKTKSRYEVTVNGRTLRIYINEVLHLAIDREKFIGLQSWIEEVDWFCIEYYYLGSDPILSEYDDFEKWKEILRLVNQNLF